MDEELAIQEELQRLQEKESAKRKKERRKENEKKRKEIIRMQMHMTTPMDIGMEQLGPGGDDATFSLKRVERDGARDVIASGKLAEIESDSEDDQTESDYDESDDEGDRLERELDSLYEQYQERREDRDSKVRAKKARKDYEAEEWDGFSDSDKEDDEESEEDGASQAVVKPAPPNSGTLSSKAAMFFDQDIFQGLGDVDDVEDEDSAIEMQEDDKSAKKGSALKKKAPKEAKKKAQAPEDFSDSDPEEPDDPRKKNGQLGMFP